ncbi:hypothetical protein GGF41_002685 [Coemansia sp. RSA 2531]|nr:hypothetical protein GGF41_002685 [Coemansia sp. RSA 2531]
MASFEDPYDFTQPTQPFEEATQVTQDDPAFGNSHQKPIGKIVWKRGEQISGKQCAAKMFVPASIQRVSCIPFSVANDLARLTRFSATTADNTFVM